MTGGVVTPEIQQLLALQSLDDQVDAMQRDLDALAPRKRALDDARSSAQAELAATESGIVTDDKRRRELEERLTDHRTKQERNLAALDQVKRIREATAAMAQVEAGRRLLIEEEQELDTLVRRVATSRDYAVKQRRAIEALEASQVDERRQLEEAGARIGGDLTAARTRRGEQAAAISRNVLSRYDRIRARRRGHAVFALVSGACACCDTAIPIHRRNAMATSGMIDVCEACGVLLYAEK
ncbi:MAG: zinc ribbon domain-containing protein [Gemmatimonadaceae bacterium]